MPTPEVTFLAALDPKLDSEWLAKLDANLHDKTLREGYFAALDAAGDMRGELRKRYGETVKLELVTATRGLLGRRIPGVGGSSAAVDIAGAAAGGLASVLEEKALWARYGL